MVADVATDWHKGVMRMADQYTFVPPSLDEYEKQRRQNAALAAGAAMLMASGGRHNLAQALGAGGLAALGSRNNMPTYQDQVLGAMKMQQQQQALEQQNAMNRALPDLAAKDFAPDAVLAAVRQYPAAALGIQKMADERTKAKLEQEKLRTETQDRRLKVAEKFGNKAAYLAKNKELTPAQVQNFVQELDKNGVTDIIGTVPFQSWANPDEARSNLSAMASMFYDIKDREAQALTERGQNLTRDTSIRGQDLSAATQRRGQDISASTQIRGQDLTDARARELAQITRETASGQKVEAQTQGLAKMIDAQSLPNLSASMRALNQTLEKYAGQKDIPGVGYVEGFLPGWAQSPDGKAVRSQVQGVANDLLKLYSGGAVTLNEAERRQIEMMAGGGYTENDLYTAWPMIVNRYNEAIANIQGGYSPEAVRLYRQRGGPALDPIVPAQRTWGKKPTTGALSPEEERELAARRVAAQRPQVPR